MKTKLMVVSDDIWTGTGFSEELKHVLFRLVQSGEYDVYWVGLQHVGHDVEVPDTMFPDLRHTGATIRMMSGVGPPELFGLRAFKPNFDRVAPDLVLLMGDPKHFAPYVKAKKEMSYPLAVYTTLDGVPIHPSWKEIFSGVDIRICMTEWAMLEWEKAGIPMFGYVHHGVNWQWMTTNKMEKLKVRRAYGIPDDMRLFINWDTNQYRKNFPALIRSWKNFRPESKKALLYLHIDTNCHLGWNIFDLIEQYKVPRKTILLPQDIYGYRKRFEQAESIEFHKSIIQMGDIYVSTTMGEGFGKTALEGLSLGMPVIITDYAASTEVCEKGSILVPTYDGSAGRYRPHDRIGSVDRAIVNEEKFVEAMLRLYDNPEEATELGIQGRVWAKEFDYDTEIIPAWLDVLGRINPDVLLAAEVLNFG